MIESGPRASVMRDTEATALIPREDWQEFLDDFSILHQEMTVRLELLREGVSETVLEDRPLLAITLDEGAGTPVVVVECGDTVGQTPYSIRHMIQDPTRLWAHERQPGQVDAIEVTARSGETLVLTVHPHPGRETIDMREVGRSETHPPGF